MKACNALVEKAPQRGLADQNEPGKTTLFLPSAPIVPRRRSGPENSAAASVVLQNQECSSSPVKADHSAFQTKARTPSFLLF